MELYSGSNVKNGVRKEYHNLFLGCVASDMYQITHAGREFGNIVPGRGFCQADPISSYLFLICIEGFTTIIKKYERRKLIRGIQVARGALIVSHMLFANDNYIFCRADKEEANQINHLLVVFDKASGHKISIEKSIVFFSKNVQVETRRDVCEVLRFKEANENCHYLGLVNLIGMNKTMMPGYLKERVQDRVKS